MPEIIHQIEALPTKKRRQILERTRQLLEPETPEEFAQAMSEIERGEIMDLDDALKALDKPE